MLERLGKVMKIPKVLLVVTASVLLSACGGDSSSSSSQQSSNDKYTQTWSKSYDATSCLEWGTLMSQKEKWVASADMLSSLRKVDGLANPLPLDTLVDTFSEAIDTACAVEDMKISEVAVGVYVSEELLFKSQ